MKLMKAFFAELDDILEPQIKADESGLVSKLIGPVVKLLLSSTVVIVLILLIAFILTILLGV
jgi:hypothetical protein